MLLAAPYFLAIKLLSEYIAQAGPEWGWLNLIALLCCWNALKMLWLGPISLIRLARARYREHAQWRVEARLANGHDDPVETGMESPSDAA